MTSIKTEEIRTAKGAQLDKNTQYPAAVRKKNAVLRRHNEELLAGDGTMEEFEKNTKITVFIELYTKQTDSGSATKSESISNQTDCSWISLISKACIRLMMLD